MKKLLFLVVIATLVLFQNCGLPFSASSGNGNGYGGYKIGDGASTPALAQTYRETSSVVCADGSFIQSIIVYFDANTIQMTRDNCAELPQAQDIDPRDVRIEGYNLDYRGRLFRSGN
jgi:hypothetical protein